MWRFLNSIPRALKNYHGPRASVGVYVESDDKDQEAAVVVEKESQNAIQAQNENCLCPFKNANLRGTTILWRLVSRRNKKNASAGTDVDHHEAKHSHQEKEHAHHWWGSYQKDLWTFLQGSNRVLEALAAGSSFLWSPHRQKGQGHNLVYRVLFSVYGKDPVLKTLNDRDETIPELPKSVGQTLLAIKDASGSQQDRIVNELKSQSLEAALKEFEQMCTDYTSQSESLLGIRAADNGHMSEAVGHFHTACAMGNRTACFNIGLCYEMGTGVSRNVEKAKHYYELAAAKGHGQAMYNLSLLYLNVDGLQEGRGDRDKGLDWMVMAAKTGVVQAQNYMGVYFMEELGDAKRAVVYFTASARQNDTEGQYMLALCHEHGLGVEINECWAAHLYSLAASSGHDEAIYSLARFTEHGLGGLPSDRKAAMNLYTRAANLGNGEAKERLEELNILEEKKVPDMLMVGGDTRAQTPSPPHNRLLSSWSSTPDLAPFGLVYQRLWDFYHMCADVKGQMLFDPGGPACTSDEDGRASPLHKSHTTPDLSSMVACNI